MPGEDFFDKRRSFDRKQLQFDATLTPLYHDTSGDIPQESIQASTENVSAGGALFEFPVTPDNSTFYLIHLKTGNEVFPRFLLGQIKWSDEADIDDDEGAFGGVEFIIEEELTKDSVLNQLKNLPPEVYQFDRETQAAFQEYLERAVGKK
ncbi:MAG: PilZ domain-containing protein [FCB group bacterium]|nr:PilZ domain-containing protein [FCB group bacterium]